MFTTPRRIFRTAMQHITRNRWLSIASISVIMLAFFLSTLFAGLVYGSNILLNYFETQAQIIAFFKVGTDADHILELKSDIEKYLAPERVEYTSEEAALAEFQEAYKDDEVILESITENVLPASLGIRAKRLDDIPQIISFLNDEKEQEEQIEEIYYREDVVNNIRNFSKATRIAGISLVSFLAVISFLIILITVGITISSYQQEIEIMQLVGASGGYIKWPFIVTGAIYGAFGALLAIITIALLSYAGYYYAETSNLLPTLQSFFTGIPIPQVTVIQMLQLLGAEVGIGIIIGAFSSIVAVRKYVK